MGTSMTTRVTAATMRVRARLFLTVATVMMWTIAMSNHTPAATHKPYSAVPLKSTFMLAKSSEFAEPA